MGSFISLPILLLAALLQASILPLVFPIGGGPNLSFLFVLAWAINGELRQSVVWALIGGLLLDLLSALPLGTSSLGMLILVFVISGVGQQVYRIGIPLLGSLTLLGTFFYEMLVIVLIDLYELLGLMPTDRVGFNPNWLQDITIIVLPTMFYNVLLIWPIYWWMRRVQRRVAPDT